MQKYEETFKKSKEMIYILLFFGLKIKIIGLFNFIFLII